MNEIVSHSVNFLYSKTMTIVQVSRLDTLYKIENSLKTIGSDVFNSEKGVGT